MAIDDPHPTVEAPTSADHPTGDVALDDAAPHSVEAQVAATRRRDDAEEYFPLDTEGLSDDECLGVTPAKASEFGPTPYKNHHRHQSIGRVTQHTPYRSPALGAHDAYDHMDSNGKRLPPPAASDDGTTPEGEGYPAEPYDNAPRQDYNHHPHHDASVPNAGEEYYGGSYAEAEHTPYYHHGEAPPRPSHGGQFHAHSGYYDHYEQHGPSQYYAPPPRPEAYYPSQRHHRQNGPGPHEYHHGYGPYAAPQQPTPPPCQCEECVGYAYYGHYPSAAPAPAHPHQQWPTHHHAPQRRDTRPAAYNHTYAEAPAPVPSSAAKSVAATTMCCYFKQGSCKMGNDCWYSHEGSDASPCHYGIKCKAGHATLVRQKNSPPKPIGATEKGPSMRPARKHAPSPRPQPARPDEQQQLAEGPTPYPAEIAEDHDARQVVAPPPRRAGQRHSHHQVSEMEPSDMPCPYCGGYDCIATQTFPTFHGTGRTVGVRAHCSQCKRTFAL